MEFDKMKSDINKIKAPDMEFLIDNQKITSISSFIDFLRMKDEKGKKYLRNLYIVFLVFAIFYFLLFIVNPDPNLGIKDRIAGSLIFLAFTWFFIFIRLKYNQRKKIDYNLPPLAFLKNAKIRYKLWSKNLLAFIPFFILINIGSCIGLNGYLWKESNALEGILIFQLIYWVIIVVPFYIGRYLWKTNKEPIFNKIQQLIVEFNE